MPRKPALQTEYLTIPQAAARLGLTRGRVHQFVTDGRLRAVKLGRDWFIAVADLNALPPRRQGRPVGWRAPVQVKDSSLTD